MHVVLATIGTDGDIFPHIGLGAALHARGHRVTLSAPEPYRRHAEVSGIEFHALITAEEHNTMLRNPDLWHPLRSGPAMARWGGPMIPRQYEELRRLAEHPESILVANPGVLAARLVGETHGVPVVSLLLQPGLVPSCTAPPVMPGGVGIPQWLPVPLRWLYWLAVDAAGYVLVAPSLNSVRKQLGLAPVRRLFRWWLSPDLVIGLFPDWFAAPQADWPAQIRLAGFAEFDGVRGDLPADVRTFREEGPPPVLFTLGTGMAHAAMFFRTAVQTCETLGARGILITKFAELVPPNLPPGVIHCPFAPFRQLLPLCGAVVHHGGVGTTAAALEAGCPQLVLPLAWDQPDNAARVTKLGVGFALPLRRRSGRDLSAALAKLMVQETRDRCKEIAIQARAERGFEVAANWVEELALRTL
jgi:rhamnosyltransferase subunit B